MATAATAVNTCNQCKMTLGMNNVHLHETWCPTEVARRRAIHDPKPGTKEMYDYVIQKTADDWASSAGARAKAAREYDPKKNPYKHVEHCFCNSRYIKDAAAESGLSVALVRGIYYNLQKDKKAEDAVEIDWDDSYTTFEYPEDIAARRPGVTHNLTRRSAIKNITAVNPRVTANSLIPLLTDLESILTGHSGAYQSHQDLESVPQFFLTWAASNNLMDNYISWPQRRDGAIRELFRLLDKPFPNIRPLNETDPIQDDGSGTGRGGFSGRVVLNRPTDLSVLGRYREGVEKSDSEFIRKQKEAGSTDLRLNQTVAIHDYKLALQLHLDHQFSIRGPKDKIE